VKYRELHKRVKKAGWKYLNAEGSHYIYEKEGKRYPVPFHGSKEVPTGTLRKIEKDLGL
jgi:mRNA interferase HicA